MQIDLEVNKLPSAKILEQKKQMVADLTDKIKAAAAGVVVDYKGINVADDTKLRKELREAGVHYAVVKNSMLRFAVKEAGYEGLDSVLEGTTAIALSDSDPVAAARANSRSKLVLLTVASLMRRKSTNWAACPAAKLSFRCCAARYRAT